MVQRNESSLDSGGVASHPLTRAGLRRPPRGVEPTAAFVVIEMAVLFCVSALAMVSIIVSIDSDVPGQRTLQSHLEDRSPSVGASHGAVASTSRYVGSETSTKKTPDARVAQ